MTVASLGMRGAALGLIFSCGVALITSPQRTASSVFFCYAAHSPPAKWQSAVKNGCSARDRPLPSLAQTRKFLAIADPLASGGTFFASLSWVSAKMIPNPVKTYHFNITLFFIQRPVFPLGGCSLFFTGWQTLPVIQARHADRRLTRAMSHHPARDSFDDISYLGFVHGQRAHFVWGKLPGGSFPYVDPLTGAHPDTRNLVAIKACEKFLSQA